MRGKRAIGASIGLAMLTAGCNLNEGRFFREGVGTELYSAELIASTQLQEVYLGYICQQAGLSVLPSGDGFVCMPQGMGPREWTMVVQAGLNDIDQRCDAYLAWLDNKRRSAGPILQQIHDMRTATEAIMRISGLGADPIVIAGTAFGLASATFTNIQSRLLLEVNHATVQTIVLSRQKEYRRGLMTLAVENRPAAVHALRSYLRLCMPFTIETEINNTVTLAERGGSNGIAAGERDRLISPGTVAVPLRARAALEPTEGPRRRAKGATGRVEEQTGDPDVRRLQSFLCLPEDGTYNPATRIGIGVYQAALGSPKPTGVLAQRDLRVALDRIPTLGLCDSKRHQNYYERTTLVNNGDVTQLQKELNAWPAGGTITENGVMDDATRKKIAAVRGAMSLKEVPELANQVTPAFRLAVGTPPPR